MSQQIKFLIVLPHSIPKLVNNSYPNRDLTGVGVAFKLAHGITNQLTAEGKIPPKKIDLKRYLDLVALGTISDMGSLSGHRKSDLCEIWLASIAKRKTDGTFQTFFNL